MAETSLYRRHRPQSFDEVVGQEHVTRTLRNAVERDRVHHAYLFVGSRGTGKTSLAKILARSLNCVDGPTATPCGVCASCKGIAAGNALDVVEMDAASNRSVDDIRELREQVGYAPAAGSWKVYILDEAHMLTREAWNAFLKTLEEPPPNTVFVLATTEPHKVMATIVDRCQRFDFARPSVEQIAEVVTRVAAAEGISIDDGATGAIARAASGSFRDALGTLDQLVAYGGTNLETSDVLAVLGVADAELVFTATDAVAAGDGAQALRSVEELGRSGRDPSQFARDLIAHLRYVLVLRALGHAPDSFTVTAADSARVEAQAKQLGDAALVRAIDELSAALTAIREGDDARTALELALLKSARPDLDPSRRALADRLERLEQRLAGGPDSGDATTASGDRADPPATPSADQAEGDPEARSGLAALAEEAASRAEAAVSAAGDSLDVDLDRVAGMWPAVVDQVRESGSVLLSTLFEAARPVNYDSDSETVEVGFPKSAAFNKRKAETTENRERLAEALGAIIGKRLRPVYVLLDSDPNGIDDEAPEAPIEDEEAAIERVKAAFDAEEWVGQPSPPSEDATEIERESG